MTIDEKLYRLPVIGEAMRRLYSYFKKHTLFTDLIHISLGVGIGFVITSQEFLFPGILFLSVGIIGHIYAYMKG